MKTLNLFIVNRNTDQTEGRGPLRPAFYCTDRGTAVDILNSPMFCRKYGVQGCNEGEYLLEEKTIHIIESFSEFRELENKEKLDSIRSKLTKEELDVLGL